MVDVVPTDGDSSSFGHRWTMIAGLVMNLAFVFIVFFAQNITMILVGMLLCTSRRRWVCDQLLTHLALKVPCRGASSASPLQLMLSSSASVPVEMSSAVATCADRDPASADATAQLHGQLRWAPSPRS